MTRPVYTLALVAAVASFGPAGYGIAQAPTAQSLYPEVLTAQQSTPVAPLPRPGSEGAAPTPDFESGWPRPPELPGSLFRQAANPMPYACEPVPGKYFDNDPLLNPPGWPQPGWVADVALEAVGPHVFQSLTNGLPVGANAPGNLHVPISPLDWTVSPVVEVGYRLPDMFGAFMLNYQYIGTTGSGSTPFGPSGPASMTGRFSFSLSDIDYVSREFTPWEHWGMQWRFGFRQVYIFYDTQLNNSAPLAAASGLLSQSGSNFYEGWGGHVGVQLDRDLNQQLPGLSFQAKLDFGYTGGYVQQRISQTSSTGAYNFETVSNGQGSPALRGEIGFNYRSPSGRWEGFVGGFYEYWWNIGTLANYALNGVGGTTSGGELSLTGVTFRLSYNY